MKDWWHVITNFIDYDRYKVLAVITVLLLVMVGVSCEAETSSLRDPQVKVGRAGFQIEVLTLLTELESERLAALQFVEQVNAKISAHNVMVETGIADLDQQDEVKAELFEIVGSVATQWASGGVPTAAIVGTVLTAGSMLLGFGAHADKRRADKELAKRKPPDIG